MAERRRSPLDVETPDLEEGPVSHLYSKTYRVFGYPSPRSMARRGRFHREQRPEMGARYFLDSCNMCRKKLGCDRDIFMYRGDTPFCSEECRQEQIELDEAKERNRNSAGAKAARGKDEPEKAGGRRIHVAATGTVVAG